MLSKLSFESGGFAGRVHLRDIENLLPNFCFQFTRSFEDNRSGWLRCTEISRVFANGRGRNPENLSPNAKIEKSDKHEFRIARWKVNEKSATRRNGRKGWSGDSQMGFLPAQPRNLNNLQLVNNDDCNQPERDLIVASSVAYSLSDDGRRIGRHGPGPW